LAGAQLPGGSSKWTMSANETASSPELQPWLPRSSLLPLSGVPPQCKDRSAALFHLDSATRMPGSMDLAMQSDLTADSLLGAIRSGLVDMRQCGEQGSAAVSLRSQVLLPTQRGQAIRVR